jgi:hypothetical protein
VDASFLEGGADRFDAFTVSCDVIVKAATDEAATDARLSMDANEALLVVAYCGGVGGKRFRSRKRPFFATFTYLLKSPSVTSIDDSGKWFMTCIMRAVMDIAFDVVP